MQVPIYVDGNNEKHSATFSDLGQAIELPLIPAWLEVDGVPLATQVPYDPNGNPNTWHLSDLSDWMSKAIDLKGSDQEADVNDYFDQGRWDNEGGA